MLIPARTDTIAWHDVIFKNNYDVIFIKGRLKFGNQPNPAPFPSAIVIMKKGSNSMYKTLDSKEL